LTGNSVDEPDPPDDGVVGLAQFAPTTIRLRLDLGYDGTDFSGWARQPGLRTVQSDVESALAIVLHLAAPPSLIVAGRTDAGVHARGQVAHADVAVALDPPAAMIMRDIGTGDLPSANFVHDHQQWADDVVRRLNGVLAADVRVKAVSVAPDGFEARFSALSRRYSYRVADGSLDPLRRHDTMAYRGQLDLDTMNAAAQRLLGMHDFAAFCRKRDGATTVRTLLALEWARDDAGVAIARVEADAFCRSMVRALVGSLLEVGDPTRARLDVAWLVSVLAGRERAGAATVAPPHGLTLEEVRYPPDDQLRARSEQARRRRDNGPADA